MYIKYKYIILTSCTSRPSWVPQVGEGVLVQAPMPGQGCASALQDDLRSSFKALCAHIHHVLHAPSRAKVAGTIGGREAGNFKTDRTLLQIFLL